MHHTKSLLTSFISVKVDSDFPIQNLPYGVFKRPGHVAARVGVAIGDQVVDLSVLADAGLVPAVSDKTIFAASSLNRFMAQGRSVWRQTRQQITDLLRSDNPTLRDNAALRAKALLPIADVQLLLPVEIPAFTDFYSSEHHAANVGALFRDKTNPLLPNWKHLPVAYNGRASTVVVSGTPVKRPRGQVKPSPEAPPVFSPSKRLDFELEIGFFIGAGNEHGQPIPVAEAEQHIFGLTLLNDWSARDHQSWEYQPLGPFLSKSFATTISPWVVPLEAIQDFRVKLGPQVPAPLAYLAEPDASTYDIRLSVGLQTAAMSEPETICSTNLKEIYWSMAQQLAHHAVNGCRMMVGDLLGTGTISGPERQAWGSLLEATFNGREPLLLKSGEQRSFIEDGDSIVLRGYCQGEGYRIGFGTATGKILPVG